MKIALAVWYVDEDAKLLYAKNHPFFGNERTLAISIADLSELLIKVLRYRDAPLSKCLVFGI